MARQGAWITACLRTRVRPTWALAEVLDLLQERRSGLERLWRQEGIAGRGGEGTFANNYCWVCRFDGEMIVEVRAYLDSAMVDYTIHRNENLAWQ